jgi:hypothetical protein
MLHAAALMIQMIRTTAKVMAEYIFTFRQYIAFFSFRDDF